MKSLLKLILIVQISFGISNNSQAQSTTEIAGAQYGALSNAGSAHTSLWQNLINPAGIITREEFLQAGVSYSNRFNLSELSSKNLVISSPLGNGRIGGVVHSFGYSAYQQNQFAITYAKELSSKLRTGIQLNYFSVNIGEGYGRFSAVTANIGFQYDFNDKVSAGLMIKNPTRSQLSSEVQEYVESNIRGGLKFLLADNLLLLTDLDKNLDMDANVSLGLDYSPAQDWNIRGGISTLNNSISFGFGYKLKKWSIDLASMYHQVLGFSPQISLTFIND